MAWAHQIQQLLDTHEVEETPCAPDDLIRRYHKAASFAVDARRIDLALESRVVLVYAGLHHFADTLANLHGLRVKSGRSHHRNLFVVVANLGIEGIGRLDVDAEEAAQSRTRSAYGIEHNSEAELEEILALVGRLSPIVTRELRRAHPAECASLGLPLL